jgi:hypothetical protein
MGATAEAMGPSYQITSDSDVVGYHDLGPPYPAAELSNSVVEMQQKSPSIIGRHTHMARVGHNAGCQLSILGQDVVGEVSNARPAECISPLRSLSRAELGQRRPWEA